MSTDPESSSPIEPGLSDPRTGFGRFCILKKPISVEDAVKIVKQRTELSHVRLARKCGSGNKIKIPQKKKMPLVLKFYNYFFLFSS